ncbi:MAG: M23 family metallopeptidase [Gemmatimonadota bacterium]|nr:M23 family metallopeptidase [Gemmatimonadota bacterium]MDP6802788.1 M23 family metallopeptidase [Gemmatimonadota bacterium]MDP7032731.1 M23 family metallopeptidase [Gemmatimonadota bacterium]
MRNPAHRPCRPLLSAVLSVVLPLAFAGWAGRCAAGSPPAVWPTDAGWCVTSSFAEFRPGHFHSGIDISTWGRVGYECRAVADGEISRVRVSCYGYGKAVYLRLHDGRTAVYAHLSRFAGAAADSVRALQDAAGDAYLDYEFAPGSLPVSRGEVVAYTGQSGVGVPHLHFEVRDIDERPMDPLAHGFGVRDDSPPGIVRVGLVPLEPGSAVEGKAGTVLFPAKRFASGTRGEPVPVRGMIGIEVEVEETTSGCRRGLGPSRLALLEDGEERWSIDYDRFDFADAGKMDLRVDPRYSYEGRGRFHRLWTSEAEAASGAFAPSGDGALSGEAPGERVRTLEIRAHDAAGNEGGLTVVLSFAPPPGVALLALAPGGTSADSMEVLGVVDRPGRAVRRVRMEWSTDEGRNWSAPVDLPVGETGAFGACFALAGVPALVRVWAMDALGVESAPVVRATPGHPPAEVVFSTPTVVTAGAWLELLFPREGAPGDFPGAEPWGRGGLRLVLPADAPRSSTLPAAGLGADPWGRPARLPALPVPGTARVDGRTLLISPSGLGTWTLPDGAFRRPVFARLHEIPPPEDGALRPASSLFRLDTGCISPAVPCSVAIAPGPGSFDPLRLGLFVQERDGFGTIGGAWEPALEAWVAEVRTPLPVGLFEDSIPPIIEPGRLEHRADDFVFRFTLRDDGAGVDCDGVEVLVEGLPTIVELDTETGEVAARFPASVPRGESVRVKIVVADRCGNRVASELELVLEES